MIHKPMWKHLAEIPIHARGPPTAGFPAADAMVQQHYHPKSNNVPRRLQLGSGIWTNSYQMWQDLLAIGGLVGVSESRMRESAIRVMKSIDRLPMIRTRRIMLDSHGYAKLSLYISRRLAGGFCCVKEERHIIRI